MLAIKKLHTGSSLLTGMQLLICFCVVCRSVVLLFEFNNSADFFQLSLEAFSLCLFAAFLNV